MTGEKQRTRRASPMTQRTGGGADVIVEPLSVREAEVLRLLAAGMSNAEIARQLVIAVSTVNMHVKHIYGKLQVHNRVQAAAHAHALELG